MMFSGIRIFYAWRCRPLPFNGLIRKTSFGKHRQVKISIAGNTVIGMATRCELILYGYSFCSQCYFPAGSMPTKQYIRSVYEKIRRHIPAQGAAEKTR